MRILLMLFLGGVLTGCASSKSSFSPARKYSPQQLQKDYTIYRETLEEAHPGLYWYTSKDSMDRYFSWGWEKLKDSMTEGEFRRILVYVTAQIRCGHTSVRSSKAYANYIDTARISRIFPLGLKMWEDTTVVLSNLNRRDSALKRGTVITKINNQPMGLLLDTLFKYIVTDGYNRTHKYQALSNRGYFGSLYTSLFGFFPSYSIEYLDTAGQTHSSLIRPYFPLSDTLNRQRPPVQPPGARPPQRPTRKERKNMSRNAVRMLKIDSAGRVAMMDLNSFGRGYGLKSFFRRSFKELKKSNIEDLIIDVRTNSGGSPTNSTLITRYLSDHKFKVGDSLYAITKRKKHHQYIKDDYLNRVFMTFFTKRRKDGYYHMGYFERHYFKPKKKNHFNGKTYILIGGSSFSATTLFATALIDQQNVIVVGEETGGGAYGNTAWQIPTVTLPETGVRFNLPLYRLVINKNYPKNGRGVMPEVEVRPTIEAVKARKDWVLEKTLELINKDKPTTTSN